jgi:hypothetical protein
MLSTVALMTSNEGSTLTTQAEPRVPCRNDFDYLAFGSTAVLFVCLVAYLLKKNSQANKTTHNNSARWIIIAAAIMWIILGFTALVPGEPSSKNGVNDWGAADLAKFFSNAGLQVSEEKITSVGIAPDGLFDGRLSHKSLEDLGSKNAEQERSVWEDYPHTW